jgi:hypothetical protein
MGFVTAEAARESCRAALEAIDTAHRILRDTPTDEVGNDFRIEVAERLETQERTNRGLMYRMFGEIADPPDETGFIPALRDTLWARLHITPKEITRRMRLAARIRPRRALTGPPTPPELPLLAQAVEAGRSARTTSARSARRWTCCPQRSRMPIVATPNAPWSSTPPNSTPASSPPWGGA